MIQTRGEKKVLMTSRHFLCFDNYKSVRHTLFLPPCCKNIISVKFVFRINLSIFMLLISKNKLTMRKKELFLMLLSA